MAGLTVVFFSVTSAFSAVKRSKNKPRSSFRAKLCGLYCLSCEKTDFNTIENCKLSIYNYRSMSQINLLLKAYYEVLYERLEANRDFLSARIEELLTEEIAVRRFEDFDDDMYAAYRDACLAFVDERIEAYNPFGIQYLFDHTRAKDAFELELQLNWYNSKAEFEDLVNAARIKAENGLTEENLRPLAEELIEQVRAFPDKSIISAYEAQPGLRKLPDYIVARAIEEIIT